MTYYEIKFQKFRDDLLNLEEILLKDFNISIPYNSELESIILESIKLADKELNDTYYEENEDFRTSYSNVIGLHDIYSKISEIKTHINYKNLKGHLNLLSNSSIPQNKKSIVTDSGSNKIFELYIALACMKISNIVLLDDPQNSKGDNPDIIINYRNKKYGIACKAIHSNNYKTLLNNIAKGLDQIEKSDTELGLVIISLKNIINHEAYWPLTNPEEFKKGEIPKYGVYRDFKTARSKLISYAIDFVSSLNNPSEIESLLNIFSNSTKVPAEFFLFLNGTCSYFNQEKRIVTGNHKLLYKISIIDEKFVIETFKVAKHINHFMQYGMKNKTFA
ncbi:hypothetical protein AB3N62_11040 [Leptospira sp. WS4.C2]